MTHVILENLGVTINLKNGLDFYESNPIELLKSIKTSLTRKNFNLCNEKLEYPNRVCSKCNSKFTYNNFNYKLEKLDNNKYNYIYESHLKDKNYNGIQLSYTICNKCKQTDFNPNSVQGLKLSYKELENFSDEEILNIIRLRNKSPFYKENHKSLDDYKKYQSHGEFSEEQKIKNHKKRIETYNDNKNKFINDHGLNAWKNYNKQTKDTMSLDFFINKYKDFDVALKKYEERKLSVVTFAPDDGTLEDKLNYLKSYKIFSKEDFLKYLTKLLDRSNGYISKLYFLETSFTQLDNKEYFKNRKILYSLEVFSISLDELINYYEIPNYVLTNRKELFDYFDSNGKRMISYIATLDGYFFRSDIEYTFYEKIKKLNCENLYIIDVNKKYTDSDLYYDMKLYYNGTEKYIELCGSSMYRNSEYKEKQLFKRNKFGSITIHTYFVDKFISDCLNGVDIDTTKYY